MKIDCAKILTILIICFSSCAQVKYNYDLEKYDVPEYITISHSEIMSEFKNTKSIMLEFGVPDKEAKLDSLTILEYNLGQITTGEVRKKTITNGQTMANSEFNYNSKTQLDLQYTGVSINEINPFYNKTNYNLTGDISTKSKSNSNLVVNQNYITTSTIYSGSETYPKYIKFWLLNGDVMKWATLGIDKSKTIPNPMFDIEKANEIKARNEKIKAQRDEDSQEEFKTEIMIYFIAAFGIILGFTL